MTVGSTGSINFMIIRFCNGVCSGFAVPVAQQFGAGDERGLRRYVGNAVWLSAMFAGIPMVYLYNLTAGIIRAMGDSKTPLYFLIMSSGLNIVLDLFLFPAFCYCLKRLERRLKKALGGLS